MFANNECFTQGLMGVDYVFHTAAPFFDKPSLADNEPSIRKYVEATQALANAAVQYKVKKIVFTGSASSVIG